MEKRLKEIMARKEEIRSALALATSEEVTAFEAELQALDVEVKALEQSISEQNKLAEQKRKETRAAWDKELRNDPKFGGDKFLHNVTRIEKLMTEFMPETKKVLTENKSMLPPYVMRDLARIAEQLSGGEKLVTGDGLAGNAEETKKDDFDLNNYYGIKN